MLKYEKWFYGLLLGTCLVLFEVLNFRTFTRQVSIEVYGVVIAVVFLGIGAWIGIRKKKTKEDPVINLAEIPELSKREQDVLEAMAEGLSNKEIADKLFVSENTIKTHVSNILSKMQVKRRTQAILKAKNLELVPNTKE